MTDYHIPVLLNECLEALDVQPEGIYVDVTYGAGGHSQSILKKLNASGHLFGFDQDEDAEANAITDERFTFIKSNFRHLRKFLRLYGVDQVDGILMDLGVSSHQFDMAERGFSYRFDARLDMRMNQHAGFSAIEMVKRYSVKELQEVFSKYGEVRNAKTLAERIVKLRGQKDIETTYELNALLESCYLGDLQRYLSQVYQAIRMEVNDEMAALEDALEDTMSVLKKGGRAVVISYHSIEDRVVKNFFKWGNATGEQVKDDYGNMLRPMKQLNKKVILPTDEEMKRNSRARSAKLRIGIKK